MLIKNRDDIIADLKRTLHFYENRNSQVDEANIMMGEDYRTVALENYHKILQAAELLAKTKAEHRDHCEKELLKLTEMRRAYETLAMQYQEKIHELHNMHVIYEQQDG
jgi:Holliday junction resolvase-like predicted endonuclease